VQKKSIHSPQKRNSVKEKVSLIFPWPHSILSKQSQNNFIFTYVTHGEFKKPGPAYGIWDSQEVCGIVPNEHILSSREGAASCKAYHQKCISVTKILGAQIQSKALSNQSLLLSLCTSHRSPRRLISCDQITASVAATRVTGAYLTAELQPDWSWNWRCPRTVCVPGELQRIRSSRTNYTLYLPLHSGYLTNPCRSQPLLRTRLSYSLSRAASIRPPDSRTLSEYHKCYRTWPQGTLGII